VVRLSKVLIGVSVLAAVAAIAAVAAVRQWSAGSGTGPSLSVTVDGRTVALHEGTTLRRAAALLRLRPEAGDLVDVDGRVLRRGVYPGRMLLNGHPATAATQLHGGDRIRVVEGRDRREPTRRQLVRLRSGILPNPLFTLARTAGSELIVRGAISHKLVSVRYEPRGAAKAERAVALTFDDGPNPQYTPRILAVLRRLGVPATFFPIGYLAEAYPDLVKAELHAGMTVGNHSYTHSQVPPFGQLPRELIDDQIALCARSVRRAGGEPKLFRPPGGSFSPLVVRAAEELGERTVLWSVDPGDWQRGATTRRIVRSVLAAVRPGSIVLLHDGGGDRSPTVAALPRIVKGIRRRGLRLVAVPVS
jgi:peptidoglycan/xylan/chitin deacetylase (PgdA/CDA1 family)